MNLEIFDAKVADLKSGVLILPAFEVAPGVTELHSALLEESDKASGGLLRELYRNTEFKGKPMETLMLHRVYGLPTPRLLLVGCGDRAKLTPLTLARMAGTAVRFLKQRSIPDATLYLDGDLATEANVAEIANGAVAANFEVGGLKTQDKDSNTLFALLRVATESGAAELQSALQKGRILGESQNFARNLANLPGNILTPRELMEKAREMVRDTVLSINVLYRGQMEELGMGALLGVAQGSDEAPFFLHVSYEPVDAPADIHLGLVGKAVTFDTGGISIKPADGMEKMKYDMSGGAAVLGAMRAIAQLKPPLRVSAFVPIVENMPSGKALRPGDILTSLSGKTIEVLNTDAEGRLILADAITYAKRQGCTHLIDAATLTGAVVVALGFEHVGFFCNNDAFRDTIAGAAKAASERFWPMPLDPEYREYLKSDFADIGNIGGRWGGACTAAKFLEEFAEDTPWAHLDIAGTAWLESAKPYSPKGPSGIAVKTFVELALQMAAPQSD